MCMPMIEVSKVRVPKRLRQVDQRKVDDLVQSINEIGLITPIVINKNVLVCGNHRLEAFKRLGRTQIPYTVQSDTTKKDQDLLIEIDENLVRNELTQRQRDEHIALKTKILAKRYKSKHLEQAIKAKAVEKSQDEDKLRTKVLEADNFTGDFRQVGEKVTENKNNYRGDFRPVDEKVTENVKAIIRSAERNALSEAKKEVAVSLGHADTKAINRMIKDDEAVTKANLDEGKLNQLNSTQLKEIAKVARKNPEKAKLVLDQQITFNAAKSAGLIPKNASVHTNDSYTKISKDMGVIRSARALIKKHYLDDLSTVNKRTLEKASIALDEVLAGLNKFRDRFDKQH